ncbi:AI-2E family transporter [Catellatospora sichuanensis]|uniref:AI-2E family transporter n=1 Tax=Catellatospora sichuanensis TaxID=1969805 RepID=UPI001643220D|nr:AI-2E family transporter [Catellatospora sichuanensis]
MSTADVFRWAVAASCGIALVGVVLAAVWSVRGILVLVLVSLFVAVSLDPAVRWLVRHRIRRPYAVTIILVVVAALIALVLAGIGPPLVRQAGQLTSDLPAHIQDLDERSRAFRELSARYGLGDRLNELVASVPERVGTSLLSLFRTFLGVLAAALTVLVLSLYFLADMPRLRRRVQLMAPDRQRERARRIVDVVVDKVGSYMIGNLLISVIAGVIAYVGLLVLGIPFALPLALVVAVTDLIPLVGATLGTAVCGLVAALTSGLWPAAIGIVIWLLIYQQIENYVIVPKVMKQSLDMPALAVLLASLLGAGLLGLVGALMAIPIAATVKTVLVELRRPLPPEHLPEPADDSDHRPAGTEP